MQLAYLLRMYKTPAFSLTELFVGVINCILLIYNSVKQLDGKNRGDQKMEELYGKFFESGTSVP